MVLSEVIFIHIILTNEYGLYKTLSLNYVSLSYFVVLSIKCLTRCMREDCKTGRLNDVFGDSETIFFILNKTLKEFSSVSSGKTEKAAANNFQAYQASVSDAWDIEVRVLC